MSAHGQLAAYSAVSFLNRAFKALLIVMLLASLLGAFGVTVGLAALGVGGPAIALGAQKPSENLIGSLTLIADRPMRIGDFGKFGETLGTVEEIGIRSTRIRTMLTMPNGQLSALAIEKYSQRDRYWFHPILNLPYDTSPDQMRRVAGVVRHARVPFQGRNRERTGAPDLARPAPARYRNLRLRHRLELRWVPRNPGGASAALHGHRRG